MDANAPASATAGITSTEESILKSWLKTSVPTARTYDQAMQVLTQQLNRTTDKKLNTVLLQELLDAVALNKFQPPTVGFTRLLELLPPAKQSRVVTDDMVLRTIPREKWPSFRPAQWIQQHARAATAAVKLGDLTCATKAVWTEFLSEFKLDFGDLSAEYEKYKLDFEYEDAALSDYLDDVVRAEKLEPALKKLSRGVQAEFHTGEPEIFVELDYVHWTKDPKAVVATVDLEISVHLDPQDILRKIGKFLPPLAQALD